MATLSEILLANRTHSVDVLSKAVDEEVASKSGLGGMAIKAGFSAATKAKPGLVNKAIDALLPQFAEKLQPYWEQKGDKSFADALVANKAAAADSLLEVTDAAMKNPKYSALSKVYGGLRPKAKSQVEDALPRVGAAIESLA